MCKWNFTKKMENLFNLYMNQPKLNCLSTKISFVFYLYFTKIFYIILSYYFLLEDLSANFQSIELSCNVSFPTKAELLKTYFSPIISRWRSFFIGSLLSAPEGVSRKASRAELLSDPLGRRLSSIYASLVHTMFYPW